MFYILCSNTKDIKILFIVYKMCNTYDILIIVESPSKCSFFENYLRDYNVKCVASCGHFREINLLSDIVFNENKTIDVKFTVADKSVKRVALLKKYIKMFDSKQIIIATDNDREGEAIGWHICEHFNLPIATTRRMIFNEITEKCVRSSFLSPSLLNVKLIEAQKTRQIIDFIVGFKVSPVLWKLSHNKKLSAGRCQTPALHLIYENNEHIAKNKNNDITHKVIGYFTNEYIPFTNTTEFKDTNCNATLNNNDLTTYLSNMKTEYIYNYVINETNISAPTPFSTSILQQQSSNKLNYSPKETMSLCQKLYEKGLITYMRTDSTSYNSDFVSDVCIYINNEYGKEFNGSVTQTDSNEAHEAIRITNLQEVLDSNLPKKEQTMYNFIRCNTIRSLMCDAKVNVLSATFTCAENNKHNIFKHDCSETTFLGWKKHAYRDNDDEQSYFNYLSRLTKNKDKLYVLHKIVTKPITQHLFHYTEAKLVSLLEQKGIGRPSTFATIVNTIQERKYAKKTDIEGKQVVSNIYNIDEFRDGNNLVYKTLTQINVGGEKNKLIINELGIVVNDLLYKYFQEIFTYTYTNSLENKLDSIANNNMNWIDVCVDCNNEVDCLISKIDNALIHNFEYKFDDNHLFMFAKYGPVVKYTENTSKKKNKSSPFVTFKKVINDIDYDRLRNGHYSLDEILVQNIEEDNISLSSSIGIFNGKQIYVKKGRYGLYAVYGASNVSLKKFGNRPIENINLKEVIPILKYYDKKESRPYKYK